MAIRSTPMRHLLMIVVTTLFLVLVLSVTAISDDVKCNCSRPVDRSSFPSDFIFGGGAAAYQFEGAYKEDGKGPSVWDYFTHKYPEKITDHSNGDVADNSYHFYREDIHILKDMGFDYYRFSISWSRILPHGKLSGGVNSKGIKYYNDLINELLAKGYNTFPPLFHKYYELKKVIYEIRVCIYIYICAGIKPMVTMFHFDIPLALENEYGGLLSPEFAIDFRAYADILFYQYGDRVKLWTTINEPWTNSNNAYASGSMAPGRCSAWQHNNCTGGDSGTEPYIVTHNQLLAHAAAVQLYREKYQPWQKGEIGITLNAHWYIPYNVSSVLDHRAAQRSCEFMHGWFLHPLTYGTYPRSMRRLVKDRLPKFTPKQKELVKGSFDFMGINYYTTYYAINVNETDPNHLSYLTDSHSNTTSIGINGNPIGDESGSSWLYVYPRGFKELLAYIKKYFKNPTIYITENGVSETNNETIPLFEQLLDFKRIDYYKEHFCCLHKSINDDKVVVKGYMAWSLLDNFEWASGFTERFGLNYVNYNSSSLTKYSKLSALWLKSMLRGGDRPMPVQPRVSESQMIYDE